MKPIAAALVPLGLIGLAGFAMWTGHMTAAGWLVVAVVFTATSL